jgi:hypothetical protein
MDCKSLRLPRDRLTIRVTQKYQVAIRLLYFRLGIQEFYSVCAAPKPVPTPVSQRTWMTEIELIEAQRKERWSAHAVLILRRNNLKLRRAEFR